MKTSHTPHSEKLTALRKRIVSSWNRAVDTVIKALEEERLKQLKNDITK
jgi:hypothetical protein